MLKWSALAQQRSGFVGQVATLATGTAIAQAVSILVAPINSRLYSPEDYGALAAYMSASGLLSTMATLLYHFPIVLAIDDEEAHALVGVCVVSTAFTSALSVVCALLLAPFIADHFGVPELRWWFLALPLSTFYAGLTATCTAWINYRKAYTRLATTRVLTTLAVVPVTIGFGIWVEGPTGLLAGIVLSGLLSLVFAVWVARDCGFQLKRIPLRMLVKTAKQYQKYPYFKLPSDLITGLATWLPTYILVAMGGASAAGGLAMATRLLGLPMTLVGEAIGTVFRRQAAQECAETGNCRGLFQQTAMRTAAVAFMPFALVGIAGPKLFQLVLGENWRIGGEVAQILAPMFFCKLVASPLSSVYYIRGRLREDLVLHVALVLLVAGLMWAGHALASTTEAMLLGYTIAYAAIYLVYFTRSFQLSGEQSSFVARS